MAGGVTQGGMYLPAPSLTLPATPAAAGRYRCARLPTPRTLRRWWHRCVGFGEGLATPLGWACPVRIRGHGRIAGQLVAAQRLQCPASASLAPWALAGLRRPRHPAQCHDRPHTGEDVGGARAVVRLRQRPCCPFPPTRAVLPAAESTASRRTRHPLLPGLQTQAARLLMPRPRPRRILARNLIYCCYCLTGDPIPFPVPCLLLRYSSLAAACPRCCWRSSAAC